MSRILLLAGILGALVGLGVAGFDWLTADVLLEHVLELPVGLAAAAPVVGLLAALALRRWLTRGASAATADEYIRSYHDTSRHLDLHPVPGRVAASVATLGSGGSLGYEGPAIYLGAAVGTVFERRFGDRLRPGDSKVLLVAGAAAGVAAIFKAPVTGLVFALEVPFQDDLARRALLPAAMAAATSYVVFAALLGTDPILPVAGQPPFDLVDLGGAAAVGLTAGAFARLFAWVITRAKRFGAPARPANAWWRAVAAGLTLGGIFLAAHAASDTNLVFGPGYDAIRWALDPDHGVPAIVALATARVAATGATLAGGGVGGLFIPLVIQGTLVGRVASGLFDPANSTLFPVVGIAAFLGAGYRVPLAAVVFVAEFTGRPGFIVPGLIAAVAAQLVMGTASVSPYQAKGRTGHLERRLQLPLANVVDTEARTAPPDATVDELFWQHLLGSRRRSVAIVDGAAYLGMVTLDQLQELPREHWSATSATDVLRTDVPLAEPTWTLAHAAEAMSVADTDLLAVGEAGNYLGVISSADLVALDEVLEASDTAARLRLPGTRRRR